MRATQALIFMLACAAGAAAADVEHVAIFKNVEGQVDILRAGQALAAATGDKLFVSDQIKSGAGASGGVVFKDGTLLTVGPSTNIRLRDYAY